MGLFKLAKKAAKSALRRAKPFIVPTVTAFGGAAAGEIVGDVIGRPALPVTRGLPPGLAAPSGLPALPGIAGGTLPGFTRRTPPALRPTAAMGGFGFSCPAGWHHKKGDPTGRCVRNRRMNVLNPRAASRAIRRIKGAMRMLRKIERQLPKQRTRRAPSGHRARLTHQ